MTRLRLSSLIILMVITYAMCLVFHASVSNASPGSVVINEIMYHAHSNMDNDDYLELYNPTDSSISLDGWCFTEGISLCFSSAHSIAANGYVTVSRNNAQTQASYGVVPSALYTGNLSNSGETVTLKNGNGDIVDQVTYSDSVPWPVAADGDGPSLELKDPTFDNMSPSSWSASSGAPTPGAKNSVFNTELAMIDNVTVNKTEVSAGETVTIVAEVSNSDTVSLVYKIMFESDQTVNMKDDGLGADEVSNDGLFTASIPGQTAGSLVRYKVKAENTNGEVRRPATDESVNYLAYIVQDSKALEAPTFRWYMDPSDYQEMITSHLTDDYQFPAVVAIGNKVFDNSMVNVKGQSTTNWAKKKYKFELPKGYTIGAPYFTRSVDEFALNQNMPNALFVSEPLSWQAIAESGAKSSQGSLVDVFRNTPSNNQDSLGMYFLIDTFDKSWRELNGLQNKAVYKRGNDKKTRLNEDNSDIIAFRQNLQSLTGTNLKNYLLDNVDIPNVINYDALMGVLRNQDWGFYGNSYQYRDTEGTGRWGVLANDLDGSMVPSYMFGGKDTDFSLPTSNNNQYMQARLIEDALYQFPELREMYYRRVIQLYEYFYGEDKKIPTWIQQTIDTYPNSINQDLDIWRSARIAFTGNLPMKNLDKDIADAVDVDPATIEGFQMTMSADKIKRFYDYDYTRFTKHINHLISQGQLPTPQVNPVVYINEIMYQAPEGEDYEYLELSNPSNASVDVSGWRFSEGIDVTLPPGSVIPADSYALVVKNDVAFRSQYGSGKLILSEYSGNLSNEGESVTLRRSDDTVVSSITYGIQGEWPTAPAGSGASLALIRGSTEVGLAICWTFSPNGGTPGTANGSVSAIPQACTTSSRSDQNHKKLSGTINKLLQLGPSADFVNNSGETLEDSLHSTQAAPKLQNNGVYSGDNQFNSVALRKLVLLLVVFTAFTIFCVLKFLKLGTKL